MFLREVMEKIVFNVIEPEERLWNCFALFLETLFSRNWAHVLSSRAANFQPFWLKFGEKVPIQRSSKTVSAFFFFSVLSKVINKWSNKSDIFSNLEV